MTTIAELGIKVDSGDAAQAATDLDKLAAAGSRAEKAAEGVSSGFDKASTSAAGLNTAETKLNETTEQAMTRLTAMAKASLDSSEYYQRLTTSVTSNTSAVDASSSSVSSLAALRRRLQADSDALVGSTDQLAESTKKAAAATGIEAEGLQALLGKINPALTALGKLDEQQAQLQKYKNAGLIDADTFKEYSTRIDASRQKLGDFGETLKKTGTSSAQTEQALRQLPSQFSDIFTSLAGGQNPLLVLIQQGGQIKDSFGGIGPTIDVLGGKIKSILGIGGGIGAVGEAFESVGTGAKAAADGAEAAGAGLGAMAEGANTAADAAKNAKEAAGALNAATPPLSIGFGLVVAGAVAAAAAITALIYGYSQGSKETDNFNKALILTGNVAGTTSGSLAVMARQVAAVNGTIGEAAASLAQIANSGSIASGSFKTVADAAAAMEDATGKAVEKTVSEFVKIGKDPVGAAKELNDQYNFLTASVYSQIVALKEQGDTIGAAKLLTDAYADAINDRSGDITKNLGLWERGWKAVGDSAKATLDSVKNIGREQDDAQKIVELQQKAAYAQSQVNYDPSDTDAAQRLSATKQELAFLTQQRETQNAIAAAKGNEAQRQKEAIAAEQRLKLISDSNLTNAEKRDKLTKAYLRDVEVLKKANPDDPKVQADYVAKTLQNIKDKNKDPAKPAGSVDLTAFNTAQNQLKSITGYYDTAQKELDASQKAGLVSAESYASQRAAIIEQQNGDVTSAYEAEIAALEAAKGKASTSAEQRIQLDQKIADARTSMVEAQKKADSELSVLATSEVGRLKKQELAVSTYTDALDQQVKTLRQQGQRSAATLGMGDRQRGLADQQNSVDDRANQQKVELANQYGDGSRGMSLDEYNLKLAALNKNQKDLRDTVQTNYDDMTVAQGSWSAGASSAFQNYLESARDVAGQTKSLFTSAFSSMEDSVANFAITGKGSFADFTKSILADMARIATRQASSALLSSLVGAATSYFTGGNGNGLATGSAGAISSNAGASAAGYSNSALSGWSGVAQAKGGAWSNGVQMFANGAAFTNSIVSKPTAFGMAGGGVGVMGEAGDEAIMPLTRTAGGQLGVRALGGGGGSGSNTYNFPVSVSVQTTGDSGGASSQEASAQLGKGIQQAAKSEAETAIARALQPGGSIWRLTNGR
ncbi:phage tail tape measure protein [Pseudomonas syringae group genomosp. 3]|uniref:phage tail tape measure protein n=1 Tax=Pseudomonas syringae group genomosp. 3 TaxID=251701 RepID=UPI000F002DF2|nr:phage tail tape measure protein [Pseudomonas syringae group genomosp. 3]RMR16378.1 Prophage PssSM-02, tail length tape-measure protein [Pseudomonas syringae pv. persicae]